MPTLLTQADINTLGSLVQAENRLGYYDYLASKGYAYGGLAGNVVRDQGLSGITANLFAENKADELGKSLSAGDWTQLSISLMQQDFLAVQSIWNVASAGGATAVDVTLEVETIRAYHSDVFDDLDNLPPQTWTAYTPTLVVADADALWAEILAAQSFWGQLDSGLGVMGDVIAATPTLMQPAYYVLAVQIHLGSPIGQLGQLAAQSVADTTLQGNAALAHEWLDDMLFDGVGAQALLQAAPQGFAEAKDALIDSLGFGKSLGGVAGPEGTNAAELILGGEAAEVISGGAGNDVIYADALQSYLLDAFPEEEAWTTGGDAIDGGEGVDTILGGAGHDFLIDDVGNGGVMMGGAGNDVLDCWFDGATLAGGPGNDLIYSAWNATGLTILFAEGDGLDITHIRVDRAKSIVIDGSVAGFTIGYSVELPDMLIRLTSGDALFIPFGAESGETEENDWLNIVANNGSWTYGEALMAANSDPAAIAALDLDSAGEGAPFPGGEMTGGSGADDLVGWADADTLSGGGGADTLTGAGRSDTLDGGDAHDTLFGGSGDDTLTGGNGNDTVLGEAGDDTVIAGAGSDSIDGGAGQDWIDATAAASTVYTVDLMQQKLVGIGGQDLLLGIEHIQGSGYGEGVIGDDAANSLFGHGGADHVWANAGHDEAWGGDGNDGLHGGAGNDSLFGDDGDDTVDGQWGDDVLYGNDGDDSLVGGDGHDVLHGEDGDDILTGGNGADRFVFYTFDGEDTVQDFTPGTDKLELWVYSTTAAQVLAGATVSGTDTLLHLYQTEIRLVGIAPNQLSTGDIVFGD